MDIENIGIGFERTATTKHQGTRVADLNRRPPALHGVVAAGWTTCSDTRQPRLVHPSLLMANHRKSWVYGTPAASHDDSS